MFEEGCKFTAEQHELAVGTAKLRRDVWLLLLGTFAALVTSLIALWKAFHP